MESHTGIYYDVIIESCVGHSTAAYWEAGGGGALASASQQGQAGRPPHTRVGSSYVLYGKGSCLFGSRMHAPSARLLRCSAARERRRAKSMNERKGQSQSTQARRERQHQGEKIPVRGLEEENKEIY
eukprot:scaffold99181_cov44-Attheya_sp.AAC.1